ncbi:hypothetical protein ACMD2_00915 [Ananas comosus]|uniref:Uncharacterized protein n=1 Tax=Ananas comosus TaxID=4615 RepID=A0A199ULN6_ANACO|nr:hypothetical protein ACMD2_00915 [Ananas comosus]
MARAHQTKVVSGSCDHDRFSQPGSPRRTQKPAHTPDLRCAPAGPTTCRPSIGPLGVRGRSSPPSFLSPPRLRVQKTPKSIASARFRFRSKEKKGRKKRDAKLVTFVDLRVEGRI